MTDPDSPGLRPPTGVPDLIDDYRKQQDALRRQALELAHLRAEVLATAEGEAAALVSTTRAQISSLLVDARRKLLELAAQVQAIAEMPDGPSARDTSETRDRILQARHEVRRGLEEAVPDIERLSEAARSLRLNPRNAPAETVNEPKLPSAFLEGETLEQSAPTRAVIQRGRSWITWVGAFVVTGAIVLAGTFWWMRSEMSSTALRTTTALSPAAAPNQASASSASRPAAAEKTPADKSQSSVIQANDRPLTLTIDTIGAAWIRTTIDGRADGGRVFGPGETKTIAADREIVLRVGDAGAVFVTQNGARKPLGARGLVATRRFAIEPSSPQRPAASPTAAPAVPTSTVPSTAPPPPAVRPPAEPASNAGPTLTAAAERWLEAYDRHDAAGLASVATRDMKVTDERGATDRLPIGAANARRALDRVAFQFVGDSALLTARIVEEATVDGQRLERVAWLSQMWIREGSQWRLMDVHILSDAKLKQPAPKLSPEKTLPG